MANKSFILLAVFLAFASCNKAEPSGFWKNYKAEFLQKNISDQGPYGGHRAMHWKADKTNTFNSGNIVDFSQKNRWILVDSFEFTQDQTNKWTYNGKAVFPLTSTGFCDTSLNDAHLQDFPRWFGGQIKVYKFKTGWVTIDPDTNNSIEENGFVLLSNGKKEMAVYHLWGE
jgi:hypothetical protein